MGVSAAQGSAGLKPGVCTSTTRPSNPFEGQMIYETDTDLTYIWGGTAWQQITGGTAVGNSGLVYITQATLTGSSVSIASCFSATYDSYLLQFTNAKNNTGATVVGWQLLNGATPITTSTYNRQRASLQSGAWVLNTEPNTTSGNLITLGTDIAQGGTFTICNPFLATTTVSYSTGIYSGNAAAAILEIMPTTHTGTTSCDGIKITNSQTFASGKVIVYGFRQS